MTTKKDVEPARSYVGLAISVTWPFRIVNKECLFAYCVEISVDLKHIKSSVR